MEIIRQYKGCACLLLCALLGSCSGPDTGVSDNRTEIRLFTELSAPTRSAIDRFAGETIVFAAGSSPGLYGEVWEARAGGGDAILLSPHYYPEDNSRVYLRGYYPSAPLATGGVSFALDGQQDVLLSDEQNGCLTDMFRAESKRFTFRHLLMQVNIRLKVTDTYPAGAMLKRLRLGGSGPKALLNLEKGSMTYDGETVPLTVWETSGTGLPLDRAYPDTLIGPVMAQPAVPLTLEVTLTLSGGAERVYPALPIRFAEADGLSVAGTAYTLSVVLGHDTEGATDSLSVSATVHEWMESNGGEIEL